MKEKSLSSPTNPVTSTACAIEAMVSLVRIGLWSFMSYHVEVVLKYTAELSEITLALSQLAEPN